MDQLDDKQIKKYKRIWEIITKLPKDKQKKYIHEKLSVEDVKNLRAISQAAPKRKPIYKSGRNKILCCSIINMTREDERNFQMTALVGFLYQMINEFEHSSAEDYPSENGGDLGLEIVETRKLYTIQKPKLYYEKLWKSDPTDKQKKANYYGAYLEYCKNLLDRAENEYIPKKEKHANLNTQITDTEKLIDKIKKNIPEIENVKIKSKKKDEITYYEKEIEKLRPQLEDARVAKEKYLDKIRFYKTEIENTRKYIKSHKLNPKLKPVKLDGDDDAHIIEYAKKKLGIERTKEEHVSMIQDYIYDFVNHFFAYDPNEHIRAQYKPDYDKEIAEKLKKNPTHYKRDKRGLLITKNYCEYLVPPADTFNTFKRYTETNYEYLRQCTNDIYGRYADFENIVIPHEDFEGSTLEEVKEKAKKWENKYMAELDLNVHQIPYNHWSFIDAWDENRNRIRLGGTEKTRFIDAVMERMRADARIGQDLMKKKVGKMKNRVKTNIVSDVEGLGAERIDIPENVDELKDDEVAVNVINIGGRRHGRKYVPSTETWEFHIEAEPGEVADMQKNKIK